MNQTQEKEPQVNYLGRWVDKKHFRTFVYNKTEQKLATSYDEYLKLIESGLWFSQKEEVENVSVIPITAKPNGKAKHGSPDS